MKTKKAVINTGTTTSVGELIETLSVLPLDYQVYFGGSSSISILASAEIKSALLDENQSIEEMFENEEEYVEALSAGKQLASSITKCYIAYIKDCYLRDTQVFNPENEFEDADGMEYYGDWHDFSGSIFLGGYKSNEEKLEELRKNIAKQYSLNPRVIEIVPVK